MQIKDIALGRTLTRKEQALDILCAKGSDLTRYLAEAQKLREKYRGDTISLCAIINAKSGQCPENCRFCAQSAHYRTEAPVFPLKSVHEIVEDARKAQAQGARCYGIVTSGTAITQGAELERILEAIHIIRKTLSIAPSASLGILSKDTASALASAGCLTYHHNLETARSFFPTICTTHDYDDDIATILTAKEAGMKVCSGGILGLGESMEQRFELADTLRALQLRALQVDSIPLNFFNPIPGTPLEHHGDLTPMDCIRAICMFRFILPNRSIRVCGGREVNLRNFQSWIFMAGADGMMVGNYLTVNGRNLQEDMQMLSDAEVTINAG